MTLTALAFPSGLKCNDRQGDSVVVSASTPSAPLDAIPVRRPKNRPMNVLFAGDSLTYGLYASRETAGFRSVMQAALMKRGPISVSRGEKKGGGVSTVGALVAVSANLDLAIVELGTNDITRTSRVDFTVRYNTLLDKIVSSGTPSLVCAGAWGNQDVVRNFDMIISDACTSHSGVFVPLFPLFDDAKNRGPSGIRTWGGLSDNFHPNDRGHEAIATLLLSKISGI